MHKPPAGPPTAAEVPLPCVLTPTPPGPRTPRPGAQTPRPPIPLPGVIHGPGERF